jgi:regulator-associated protein of mTOR
MRECILLAACGAGELLPQNPELPADVFTACLTTPIKVHSWWISLLHVKRVTYEVGSCRNSTLAAAETSPKVTQEATHQWVPALRLLCCKQVALRWFCNRSLLRGEGLARELIDRIPGKQTDRRTPLGELNWIFTAITDTIAWNMLPRALFQKLFRQASFDVHPLCPPALLPVGSAWMLHFWNNISPLTVQQAHFWRIWTQSQQ